MPTCCVRMGILMSTSFTFWSSPLDQPSSHYSALSWCATYIILRNDETGTIILICYLWQRTASSYELENVSGEAVFLPPVLHGFTFICLATMRQLLSWVDPSPRPWSNQVSAAGHSGAVWLQLLMQCCLHCHGMRCCFQMWNAELRYWQQMHWWTCAFSSWASQIL